mmetsp:Transcript_111273/g.346883  ORF Transcript_111273/g.346883 Transcript_111273/m.346883 type:complete len:451 (-) Transcript_111273:15-1367(-)
MHFLRRFQQNTCGKGGWQGPLRDDLPSRGDDAVELRVWLLDGSMYRVSAGRQWRGFDVKRAVETVSGISLMEQRLFVGTEELEDVSTLAGLDAADVSLLRRSEEEVYWMKQMLEPTHSDFFQRAPEHIQQNPPTHSDVFQRAPEHIQQNPEFLRMAMFLDTSILRVAPEALRRNKHVLRGALQHHWPGKLVEVDTEVLEDRAFALSLVEANGYVLELLPARYRADKDIVVAAVRAQPRAAEFVTSDFEGLWADKDFVLLAVGASEAPLLERATSELRADPDVVLATVRANVRNTEFMAESLWADKDIALAAVQAGGKAAGEYVSRSLWANKDFVLAAARVDCIAKDYIASELMHDREVEVALMVVDASLMESSGHREDKEFVLAAVAQAPSVLDYAPREHFDDINFVRACVHCLLDLGHNVPCMPERLMDANGFNPAYNDYWEALESAAP